MKRWGRWVPGGGPDERQGRRSPRLRSRLPARFEAWRPSGPACVMELADGTDVHQMVAEQGRLSPEQALPIAANVLPSGHHAAHHLCRWRLLGQA